MSCKSICIKPVTIRAIMTITTGHYDAHCGQQMDPIRANLMAPLFCLPASDWTLPP